MHLWTLELSCDPRGDKKDDTVHNRSTRQLERQINSFYYQKSCTIRTELCRERNSSIEKGVKAKYIIRAPYVLEFFGLQQTPNLYEKDIEQGLIDYLQKFLLELGRGFFFHSETKTHYH